MSRVWNGRNYIWSDITSPDYKKMEQKTKEYNSLTGRSMRNAIVPNDIKRVNVEILLKLPSLNEYVNACRKNAYAGAKMKKDVENDIMWFIKKLPKFERPIKIHFTWVEGNKKRDLDNICFAKKFILDAMVKAGKLKDDNRKCVTAFTDSFEYGKETKVILEIEETDNADDR